jgi:hypothetical protein
MADVQQFHRIWLAQKLGAECATFYTFFQGAAEKDLFLHGPKSWARAWVSQIKSK